MHSSEWFLFSWVCLPLALGACTAAHAQEAAPLPPGVQAIWDLEQAHREATPSRERICINGLWRWQPAESMPGRVPAENWGYFKVPGCWPGITDYMQKDCQIVHAHPVWKDRPLRELSAAWYQREIVIPGHWTGRELRLQVDYLNTLAEVYVDGTKVGDLQFPGGELDLSGHCRPGQRHVLTLHVLATSLDAVILAYSDSASARQVKGSVARRGLCGDVFLLGVPPGAQLSAVRVRTSVRNGQLAVVAVPERLAAHRRYTLRAKVTEEDRLVKSFESPAFKAADLQHGRATFHADWRPDKCWDTHTPQNQYTLYLSLVDDHGQVLDTSLPVRFGFREFWIEGRDFYLNGKRIYLSALPFDNAQVGAAWASYAGAKESLERLRSFGINLVYTHNYDCRPGSHLGFNEILQACDDTGMLMAFTQPHFAQYDWQAPDADTANGYAHHADYYVRAAGSHPSVVAYSTSHNATGYAEDMNPDLIDGVYDQRSQWARKNAERALRAEAIINSLDPHRVVYHHAGGNLGSMHTSNFYPNFVPIQEMSDWFGHWAAEGVKPLFLCEYGAPFTWDWSMYRGWYREKRAFGSARVPWEFCLAEWNAQFLGSPAYRISKMEQRNLRWEAEQSRAGRVWHRWDYPHAVGSRDFDERYPVLAAYITDNWRAFRTWGVSAISPWEHGIYWKTSPSLDRNRRVALETDWTQLQRPGFSPDYLEERYERMDLAYERDDWVATPAAEAMRRNNGDWLAWIAGKPGHFTSKDHLFQPGERVDKQLVVINNTRRSARFDCRWILDLPTPLSGERTVELDTGEQERLPLSFDLPANLVPGTYMLTASATREGDPAQLDTIALHILHRPSSPRLKTRIALFDPVGDTERMLDGLDIRYRTVGPQSVPTDSDLLVIGRKALTVSGAAPDLSAVRDGLRVLVCEQDADVLEQRLGFRVQEYGLRRVFPRVSPHPALAGLTADHLRNWRGEATTLPPRLDYTLSPAYNETPTVLWCGIEVPRLWRCGNRGNVASVLIEKPARGNFLPILDGGYSLQYSPLLEYREGDGMVLFCQMDVTGRTENDPAASRLVRNLLEYATAWQVAPRRQAFYAGDPAGHHHLEAAGFRMNPYVGAHLGSNQVLVVGSGGGAVLADHATDLATWLNAGGRLLALELSAPEANTFLPSPIQTHQEEHIATFFAPVGADSPLAGIGPADVHNRNPRTLPLIRAGAMVIGNGVLAHSENGRIAFCQLAPYRLDPEKGHQRRTYRRHSFLLTRLLANQGVEAQTPLLDRFSTPPAKGRWTRGLYLDQPMAWDDPYRFFRW